MARSFLKQLEAIRASVTYDDLISSVHTGGVAEAQVTALGDFNVIRSLIRDIVDPASDWFVTPAESILDLAARPDPSTIRVLDYVQHGVSQATGTGSSTDVTAQAFGILADEAGTDKGVLASTTIGDIAGEGGKNRIDIVDASTGDPVDDDDGNRVYGYLFVDSIASPTDKDIFWYSEVGGTETSHSFASTRTVILTCRKRFTLDDVPETFALSGTNLVDNLSQEVDLGDLNYTEDNFVTDGATFTANVDELDKATEDHRLLLGTAAGTDVFALNTNFWSSATLDVEDALNELDDSISINGAGNSNLTYDDGAAPNFLATGDSLESAIEKLDDQIKINENNIASSSAQKEVEKGVGPIASGSAHTLPGSLTYTLATGDNLDVFLNGQLLVEGASEDYLEDTTTTIKFNFTVGSGSNLTYFARV